MHFQTAATTTAIAISCWQVRTSNIKLMFHHQDLHQPLRTIHRLHHKPIPIMNRILSIQAKYLLILNSNNNNNSQESNSSNNNNIHLLLVVY